MDGFHEKKWFVYLGDHHEGPFSLDDIQQKMGQGVVNRANYVWCDGMADWAPMPQVAAFAGILEAPVPQEVPKFEMPSPSSEPAFGQPMEVSPVAPVEIVAAPEAVSTMEESPSSGDIAEVATSATLVQPMETVVATPMEVEPARPAVVEKEDATGKLDREDIFHIQAQSAKKRGLTPRAKKLLVLLVLVAAAGAAYSQGLLDSLFQSAGFEVATRTLSERARPYLIQLIEKFPQVGTWISPLPDLSDVAPEDVELLKSAAVAPVTTPRMAIVASQSDPLAPALYVAANVPDGTTLELTVIGIPDTLLNHLSFATKVVVMIEQRLGKSAPLHFSGGLPGENAVPRGEYRIFVTAGEPEMPASRMALARFPEPTLNQASPDFPAELKTAKVVAIRSLFLGGKRDASYAVRLKEYHDKLTAKASAELVELKQFEETLEAQLKSTTVKFDSLRRRRLKRKLRKQWNDFHVKWTGLTSNIIQTFQKVSPQALDQEHFYGSLYQMTLAAGQAVLKVHEFHEAFFTGNRDPKTFNSQLIEAQTAATISLGTLKAKIEQAGKIPPSPNGMPRKDGL